MSKQDLNLDLDIENIKEWIAHTFACGEPIRAGIADTRGVLRFKIKRLRQDPQLPAIWKLEGNLLAHSCELVAFTSTARSEISYEYRYDLSDEEEERMQKSLVWYERRIHKAVLIAESELQKRFAQKTEDIRAANTAQLKALSYDRTARVV